MSRPKDSASFFSCSECGAQFPSLQALGGHKSAHSGKRSRTGHETPSIPLAPETKRLRTWPMEDYITNNMLSTLASSLASLPRSASTVLETDSANVSSCHVGFDELVGTLSTTSKRPFLPENRHYWSQRVSPEPRPHKLQTIHNQSVPKPFLSAADNSSGEFFQALRTFPASSPALSPIWDGLSSSRDPSLASLLKPLPSGEATTTDSLWALGLKSGLLSTPLGANGGSHAQLNHSLQSAGIGKSPLVASRQTTLAHVTGAHVHDTTHWQTPMETLYRTVPLPAAPLNMPLSSLALQQSRDGLSALPSSNVLRCLIQQNNSLTQMERICSDEAVLARRQQLSGTNSSIHLGSEPNALPLPTLGLAYQVGGNRTMTPGVGNNLAMPLSHSQKYCKQAPGNVKNVKKTDNQQGSVSPLFPGTVAVKAGNNQGNHQASNNPRLEHSAVRISAEGRLRRMLLNVQDPESTPLAAFRGSHAMAQHMGAAPTMARDLAYSRAASSEGSKSLSCEQEHTKNSGAGTKGSSQKTKSPPSKADGSLPSAFAPALGQCWSMDSPAKPFGEVKGVQALGEATGLHCSEKESTDQHVPETLDTCYVLHALEHQVQSGGKTPEAEQPFIDLSLKLSL